jgi:GNAT superfamily N-acetyltransferase
MVPFGIDNQALRASRSAGQAAERPDVRPREVFELPATVRPSTAADASIIAELASAFSDYLRSIGDPNPESSQITEQQYLTDGTGPKRAFYGLIGELDDKPVGYLLYCHGYDLDLKGRVIYVIDLFVQESARRLGVGRLLMQTTAKICRDDGGNHLWWSVYVRNRLAQRFYENLGGKNIQDLDFMYFPVSVLR